VYRRQKVLLWSRAVAAETFAVCVLLCWVCRMRARTHTLVHTHNAIIRNKREELGELAGSSSQLMTTECMAHTHQAPSTFTPIADEGVMAMISREIN